MNPSTLARRRALVRGAPPLAYVTSGDGTRVPVHPIMGSDPRSGYHTEGDIARVTETADGTELDTLWSEFQDTLRIFNDHRSAIIRHLSYPTTAEVDYVQQSIAGARFELASEFGEPVSARLAPDVAKVGFDRHDYDLATRYTWRFLRDATAAQIQMIHESILEADNRETATGVLGAIFANTTREDQSTSAPIYGLYNSDGMRPPPYLGRTFDGTHNHCISTGADVIDAADVELAVRHITHHGYASAAGTRLLIFANEQESTVIQRFRAGEVAPDGSIAAWDFIAGSAAPPYLTSETIVGERPPGDYGGLPIAGSLGPAWLIETEFIPAGYLLVVATHGPGDARNPVGFRQHPNLAYQGLRLLPGNQQRYPLIDSFYSRTYGTGVRHRGAACVLQVTANATYTPPTFALS